MNKTVKHFSKIFYFTLLGLITASCISIVSLKEIKNNFENINNVKVLKVWHDDDDLDSAGAAITINDDKLLIFRRLSKKSFAPNNNVAINQIENYKLRIYSYGHHGVSNTKTREPVKSISMSTFIYFGENSIFNKKYNLNIITLEDVINNYDVILNILNNLPEYNEPINPFEFTYETFNNLKNDLSYYYDEKNDIEYVIRKIKVDGINLNELNTEAMWFELYE